MSAPLKPTHIFTKTRGFMRSLIKYSLLALACLTTLDIICPAGAIAGDRPVALPDSGSSGLGDTFSPEEREYSSKTTAQISRKLAETLQQIQTRQSVESVGGQMIALSSEELNAIADAVSTEIDLDSLEQQLTTEMGGLALEISALEVSPDNLAAAVDAMNKLVLSLDSEQLAMAIKSPVFISLLRLLEAANQATGEDGNFATVSSDRANRLLQVRRL